MTSRRLIVPLTGGLMLALAFIAVDAAPAPLILLNVSHSLPQGAWRLSRRPAGVGEVVALRPPPAASGYLSGLGYPPGTPLLKRVVALGEGAVCAGPGGLAVGDWIIPRRSRDRRGEPLPGWSGCRPLADDELIVLGVSADSYDSRYFGPVRRDQVLGVYEPLR